VADTDHQLAVQKRSVEDRRASTEDCRIGRRTVHAAARAIVRVGKLVNLDETMTTMQIPRKASDDDLIAYARGLLDRVSSHADAFVTAGLPPDFLKNFDSSIQELVAARDARAAAIQRYAAATALIHEKQDLTDKTVAALEAVAINLPAAHPELVTKLRMAKRVGPRVAAASKQEPAPAPEPKPVPAPEPKPEPAPEPQPEPAPAPEPSPAPAPSPAPPSTTPADKSA